MFNEWPHIPLDRLSIKVGLEAVLGKAWPSNHKALDNAPVNVPQHCCEDLQQRAAKTKPNACVGTALNAQSALRVLLELT